MVPNKLAVLSFLSCALLSCEAFAPASQDKVGTITKNSIPAFGIASVVEQKNQQSRVSRTRLFEGEADGEAPAEEGEGEDDAAIPPEDPEITALKDEIASFESQLKAKQREVDAAKDQAEQYTKTGYARKVADMENMRKMRRMVQSSNKFSSTANIVQKFLPVMDQLNGLKEQYGDDEFGAKYSGLSLAPSFKELGVAEFSPEVGAAVDKRRIAVVEEEFSNDFEKGTVIRPVSIGMEIEGNVMRMAECVASLGSEADAKKEEEEAAAAAAEGDAAPGEESE